MSHSSRKYIIHYEVVTFTEDCGITQYSSGVYIGIAMVFLFSHTSVLTFSFNSFRLLMTLQHTQNKTVYEILY